jgi:hypothetical protein
MVVNGRPYQSPYNEQGVTTVYEIVATNRRVGKVEDEINYRGPINLEFSVQEMNQGAKKLFVGKIALDNGKGWEEAYNMSHHEISLRPGRSLVKVAAPSKERIVVEGLVEHDSRDNCPSNARYMASLESRLRSGSMTVANHDGTTSKVQGELYRHIIAKVARCKEVLPYNVKLKVNGKSFPILQLVKTAKYDDV